MSKLRFPVALAALALAAAGCLGDYYDKEYVIYDSTTPAAKGSPARAEEDRIAAEADSTAAPAPEVSEAETLERLFVLENLRDELARAEADGIGDVALLARKRGDVEREIAWRRAAVGDASYDAARRERLARLQGFTVVLR